MRLKDKIAAKAKERQVAQLKQNDTVRQIFAQREDATVCPNLDKREEKRTLDILAKEAGVSRGTLHKVEKVDTTAPDPLKEAMFKVIDGDKQVQ